MRNFGFLLTLFALMIFSSDAYAQRGGGGRGGGGGQRGGGGQQGGGNQGGGQRGGGQQGGQGGGGQCQQGGGGNQMRGGGGTGGQNTTTDTSEVVTQLLLQMDRNRDGVIAQNEVPAQLQNRMADADANGDGMLNRLEQMVVIDRAKIMSGNPKANGMGLNAAIFQKLDRNRDSVISPAEVPRPLQRMFRTLDSNKDGMIEIEEQAAILKQIKSKLNPEQPPRDKKPAI